MSGGAQPDHGGEAKSHGLRHRLVHLLSHDHGPDSQQVLDAGAEGIRATKISLIGLGLTALLQALVVVLSGSVALASDTLHNLGDALTVIPLWIAFSLGRRSPTRSYTYGYHRAEDVAGVVIVLAIGASAGLIVWESVQRLLEPRLIDYIPWVIAAGLIGAAGNELVARYRIRVGEPCAGKHVHRSIGAAGDPDGTVRRTRCTRRETNGTSPSGYRPRQSSGLPHHLLKVRVTAQACCAALAGEPPAVYEPV